MAIRFMFFKTVRNADGEWNPPLESLKEPSSHEGGFQISIYGTPSDFCELGRELEAFGKDLSQSSDQNEHKHFDGLTSEDGKTAVQIILRRGS